MKDEKELLKKAMQVIAVAYYHNKIFELSKQRPLIYEREIKKQLIKWKDWN